MATIDLSRIAFNPRKHYSSVRMQQGRVIVDDDWNENERIKNEANRRINTDVIGSHGSPDQGFRIENLRTADNLIDFDIHDGSFYLGGLRLEMEPTQPGQPPIYETFRTQKDWLQQADHPIPTLSPNEERFDLVYLKAWQQPVGAIEDNELFEVALGGPDTSMRMRTMRQVRIYPNIQLGDCGPAWKKFVEKRKTENRGEINEKHECIPDIKLKVAFSVPTVQDDLCAPSVAGGYLGAENQAIRVQLVDYNHFTWGFDNASPLYRVQVDGKKVTLLTEPKDQAHWPLAGQTVEILPCYAVLPNGEKIAGMHGHLSKIESSYDPDKGEFTLTALPSTFGKEWTYPIDNDKIKGSAEYLFMRVWNRGSDITSDPAIAFTKGIPVPLGNTGLQITISGKDFITADFWIIAARPETPNRVVPWELETGLSPHGVRRFYAPLALIQWTKVNGNITGEIIHDCRKKFQPLTDLESCCTFTVGDGTHSKGDFNSMEEAILNLPADGGKICVLPGRHEANVHLDFKQKIEISGCGSHSIVHPHLDHPLEPIFSIRSSQEIKINNLSLVTTSGTAVELVDSESARIASGDIQIDNNRIIAGVHAIYIKVNNQFSGNNDIQITYNIISILDKSVAKAAIYVEADKVLIEHNRVVVVPAQIQDDPNDPRDPNDPPDVVFDPCADLQKPYIDNIRFYKFTYRTFFYASAIFTLLKRVYTAQGGIQIGSGSERVKIQDNEIIGGKGNGITLGSNLENIDTTSIDDLGAIELEHRIKSFRGEVYHNDTKLAGTELMFEHTRGETVTAKTDDTGAFLASSPIAGTYKTFLLSPGYKIESIVAQPGGDTSTTFYQIRVASVAKKADPTYLLAPICNISIDRNLISNMGLCGIGVSTFNSLENIQLMVKVEDLMIFHNTIINCLYQIPAEIPQKMVGEMGFGGIALSDCENAIIQENRIENNGIDHINPICGIFMYHGEKIDISNNRILNNGPYISNINTNVQRGISGGIVIKMSFKELVSEIFQDQELLRPDGIPAVKIHNNVVTQPLSQALIVMAFGPVSVIGNHFTSQGADFKVNPISLLAGTILIFNLGISKDLIARLLLSSYRKMAYENTNVTHAYPQVHRNRTSETSDVTAAMVSTEKGIISVLQKLLYLPSGYILFSNNQTTLDLRSIDPNFAFSSQLIVSLDDVAYTSNQSECASLNDFVLTNTCIIAPTIRTNDNRFQEGLTVAYYSLFSHGIANMATSNQATHCLHVLGNPNYVVDVPNQVLYDANCKEQSNRLVEFMAFLR